MYDYEQKTETTYSMPLQMKDAGSRSAEKTPKRRSAYESEPGRDVGSLASHLKQSFKTSMRMDDPYEGRSIQLSDSLAGRIEKGFGVKAGELKLRESAEVAGIGAKAIAQGDSIRFAPGMFRPDTREGLETIGHELSHVRGQAKGEINPSVPGGDIHYDAGNEQASDRIGREFASGGLGVAAPVSLSGMNAHNSPVQGKFDDPEQWNNNALHEDNREVDNPIFAEGDEDLRAQQGHPVAAKKEPNRKQRRAARQAVLTELPSAEDVIELGRRHSPSPFSSGYNTMVRLAAVKVAALKDTLENGNKENDESRVTALAREIQTLISELISNPMCSKSKREFWVELSSYVGASSFQRKELREKTKAKLDSVKAKAESMPQFGRGARPGAGGGSELTEQTDYVRSQGVPDLMAAIGEGLFKNLLTAGLKTGDHVLLQAREKAREFSQLGNKKGFFLKAVVGERENFDEDYLAFIDTYQKTIKIMQDICDIYSESQNPNDIENAARLFNYIVNMNEADLFAHRVYDQLKFNPDIDWDQVKGKRFVDLMRSMDILRVDTSAGSAKAIGSGAINTVYKIRAEGEDKVLKPGKRDLMLEYGFETVNVNGKQMEFPVAPYNEQNFYSQKGRAGFKKYWFESMDWKMSKEHVEQLRELYAKTKDKGSKERIRAEIVGINTMRTVFEKEKRRNAEQGGANGAGADLHYTVVEGANTSKRDVAVSRIAKLLGFNNMSNGELAVSSSGRMSLIMDMAKGMEADKFSMSDSGEDSETTLNINDHKLQLEFIKMSIVDVITGTTDRHNRNYFIQKGKTEGQQGYNYRIQGIDSDLNFSNETNMIEAEGSVGQYNDDALWLTSIKGGIPYLTKEIADKIRSLNESTVSAALTGMVTKANISATLERLEILKKKIPAGVNPDPGNDMIPVVDERELSDNHILAQRYAAQVKSAPEKYVTDKSPLGKVDDRFHFSDEQRSNLRNAPSALDRMQIITKLKENYVQQIGAKK